MILFLWTVLLFLGICEAHARISRLERRLDKKDPGCPGAGGRCGAAPGGTHDPHCAFGGLGRA